LALDFGGPGDARASCWLLLPVNPTAQLPKRLQLTRATVGKWRIRFLEHRINGPYDEVRSGKPRTIDDERLAQLIHKRLCPRISGTEH